MSTKQEEELFATAMLLFLTSAAEDSTVPRTIVELGRSPWSFFVTASAENRRALEVCAQDVRALLASELRDSMSNGLLLDKNIKKLEALLWRSNIPPEVRRQLLRDLAQQRRVAVTPLEILRKEAAETEARLASSGPRAAGTLVLSPAQAAAAPKAALIARSLRDMLGNLRAPTRTLTDADSLLIQAHAKVDATIGSQEWTVVWEYLASRTAQQRSLIKEVATAAEKLEGEKAAAIARGQQSAAEKLDQVIEDSFARIGQQVRNKLKGIVNEVYTSNWADWIYERRKLLDEAVAVAARLPPPTEWHVALVSGATGSAIKLNGREIWDEAILIVEGAFKEGTPPQGLPRTMLFAGAQFKAELDVSAIGQTINDITVREKPGSLVQIVDPSGETHNFMLYPLPPDVEPQRWILNAMGGKFSIGDLQETYKRFVNIRQFAHDLSVRECNALCNALLISAAKNYP